MSKKATEIGIFPLAPGVDLVNGDTGKKFQDIMKLVASQPGNIATYWGRQVENPDSLHLGVEWESLQHHLDFMQSPEYGPMLEAIQPLISGAPHLYHLYLPESSPFSGPGSAPVTECIELFFEPSFGTAAYDANFAKFMEEGTKHATDAQGLSGGWGEEEHDHPEIGKAKHFGAFVGWPSVEAHMNFRATEVFPEVVKHLRDGPKGVKVYHVPFQKV
ncbi:hypothetical protein EJ04DRAFT_60037 [Polyplosphaeria fusca]|uniref:ABM domain-containing protein n=1 Tax=Polyplosphaeria fusca TaxID=682080 RepID=A0A9P4R707_9PLEO|nr:hypothetical protein EJ04DRAFT_60037 [Polyplosphaeria fusca]